MNWLPGASLESLREAALLRHSIRQWMHQQAVLEVITPALSMAATTDPHVLSISTSDGRYLHTSPEFPMKRLLAAHALALSKVSPSQAQPDLYQIAQVFRSEESGRFHNSEFTLLEWYRVGMDHHALMEDLCLLLQYVWQCFDKPWPGIEIRRYGLEVRQRLGQWPEGLSVNTIADYFATHGRSFPAAIATDLDAALNLFVDEFVLPALSTQSFTWLIDYPASQAALARLGKDQEGRTVAQRFELYFGQVELANGFHELAEATVQRERFTADLVKRDELGVPRVPVDENLLAALRCGLPDCAGIALGLDRLHMVLSQRTHIEQVIGFDDRRA